MNKSGVDILDLIKTSGATRKFKDEAIPEDCLKKICEAGVWGLSILGVQPWKIVYTVNPSIIESISKTITDNSPKLSRPFETISNITAMVIKNSKALIAIYNNGQISERASVYSDAESKRARIAELQCIGGTIQNMFLTSNALGFGAIWLDSPAFFEKEINKILQEDNEFIAFLALGYSAMKPVRTKRKNCAKVVS